MNESRYQELREAGWRRKLTAAEEADVRAWLAQHPEQKVEWEAEAGLSGALRRLPNPPVSSNFTARVLQEVEREMAARQHRTAPWSWNWLWHPFLPRVGLATLAFCLGLMLTGAKQRNLAKKAESVATYSEVASLPNPEILQDFEVIRQLNATPPPDNELLALLQ